MAARKQITITQVARAAGVSTQTVSRVINERPDVAPETRLRVQSVIEQLDYRPNVLARSLIHRRSHTIGEDLPARRSPRGPRTMSARGSRDPAPTPEGRGGRRRATPGFAAAGVSRRASAPLLAWRDRFPILSTTTYLISNSLGAMPRAVYDDLHTLGPKQNFEWRMETPERGYAAGFRRLGIGALFGLADWRYEAICVAAHADFLLRHCWKSQLTISLPRLRPCAGEFQPRTHMTDRELVQLVCAFRLLWTTGCRIEVGFGAIRTKVLSSSNNAFTHQLIRTLLAICQEAQAHGAVLFHGALAELAHHGVVLAGPGGIGKSTASCRLLPPWRSLSDDATLVVRDAQGTYWAHPWPTWSQFVIDREGASWNVQHCVPLRAVFFLSQAEKDQAEPLGSGQAATLLLESSEQAWRGMQTAVVRSGAPGRVPDPSSP